MYINTRVTNVDIFVIILSQDSSYLVLRKRPNSFVTRADISFCFNRHQTTRRIGGFPVFYNNSARTSGDRDRLLLDVEIGERWVAR